MGRRLIFAAVKTHYVRLENGKTSYTLFGDSDENDESVTEVNETEITHWLFQNETAKSLFFLELLGIDCKCHFGFWNKEPILTRENQKKIGDIDMLICPEFRPDCAIAIEIKRVKVNTHDWGDPKVNKLEMVKEKGLSQIDELCKLGFSQTYLCLIIQNDGRKIKDRGTFFRYNKGEEVDAIYDIQFERKFNENAGVILIEINQPTGEHFNLRSNIGIRVDKRATAQKQPIELTNRIREWQKDS